MSTRWGRVLRGVVAVLCTGCLTGVRCESGERAAPPAASLRLEADAPRVLAGKRHLLQLSVVVESGLTFQASDVDLSWTPARAVLQAGAWAGAEFDDDGALFGSPVFDPIAGKLTNIVDLRHGPDADRSGPVAVARALFVVDGGQEVTFRVEGRVARPDGVLFDTAPDQLVVAVPAAP